MYAIFVNNDTDFPDDDPEEDPDWVENKDYEEDEILTLETSQILTSSRYLGANAQRSPWPCWATVPVFVLKSRSAVENLEDPRNIFHEQMEWRKEQRRKENKRDQSYYRDCTRNEITRSRYKMLKLAHL